MTPNSQRILTMVFVVLIALMLIGTIGTVRDIARDSEILRNKVEMLGPLQDRHHYEKVLPYCHEDEAWVPVDSNSPGGLVDSRGVTRKCVHLDNLTGHD